MIESLIDIKNDSTKVEIGDGINTILSSMEEIRKEVMLQRKISNNDKTTYIHLAEKLAKKLKQESDTNPVMLNKIENTLDSISESNSLLNYDSTQDLTWKQKNKKFINNLTEVLISVAKEKFSSTKNRYHIFQAIKCFRYMTCSTEDLDNTFKDQEYIYSTIVPVQKEIKIKDDSIWKRFGAFFLGDVYDVDKVDDFTLKITNNITLNSLDTLLSKIDGKGYNFLRFNVPENEIEILRKKYPNSKIKTTFNHNHQDRDSSSQILEVEMNIGKLNDYNNDECNNEDASEYFLKLHTLNSRKLSKYLNIYSEGSVIKYFEKENSKKASTIVPSKQIEKLFLPEIDTVLFSNIRKIEEYNKYSVLVYQNNSRNINEYMLTAIIADSELPNILNNLKNKPFSIKDNTQTGTHYSVSNKDKILSEIISVLINEQDTTTKLDDLVTTLNPCYIGLKKFDNDD